MAKVKLKLVPNPTFPAIVDIPVPGAKSSPVEFTFKHRNKEKLQEFLDGMRALEDVPLVLEIASGWDLDEPFDAENVEKLVTEYVGSASKILDTYIAHSTGTANRTKN